MSVIYVYVNSLMYSFAVLSCIISQRLAHYRALLVSEISVTAGLLKTRPGIKE